MSKIPFFNEDMDIIAVLGDIPGTDNNLSAAGLKEKFDLAGKLLKKFLNDYVVPAINGYVADNSGMLDRDGGQMNGTIDMDNNRVTNLPEPIEGGDAASKSYADKAANEAVKKALFFAMAEIGTTWTVSGESYVQSIVVPGILETDRPKICPVYSEDGAEALAQDEAWKMVSDADTGDGTITFRCLEDKPEVAIPIQIEVHR